MKKIFNAYIDISRKPDFRKSNLGCQVSLFTFPESASLTAHIPAPSGSEAVVRWGILFKAIFRERPKAMGKGAFLLGRAQEIIFNYLRCFLYRSSVWERQWDNLQKALGIVLIRMDHWVWPLYFLRIMVTVWKVYTECPLIPMQEIPYKQLLGNALITSNHQCATGHPKTHGRLKIVFKMQGGGL